MAFSRRTTTTFTSTECMSVVGCFAKVPLSVQEKVKMPYLKAASVQNGAEYHAATVEFKQEEAPLSIGDDRLMLGCQSDALEFYDSLTDKYPYLYEKFAPSVQDRIDTPIPPDASRTDLNPLPPTQQDNAQYQIATVHFNRLGMRQMLKGVGVK